MFVPRGMPHTVRNASGRPVRGLILISRSGEREPGRHELSAPDAKAALYRALQQLEASYHATFAGLNCD